MENTLIHIKFHNFTILIEQKSNIFKKVLNYRSKNMNVHIPLSSKFIFPSRLLPLTMVSLEDLSIIIVSGNNVKKYLQNQFTCDLNSLSEVNFVFSAHCNFQGKVISCVYVFHLLDGIACITRKSLLNEQIQVLKKYSIFSKISVKFNEDLVLIGITGLHAENFLIGSFGIVPNKEKSVVRYKETTLLYFYFPSPRYLLVTTNVIYNVLKEKIGKNILFNSNKQWFLLDMESNYPILDISSSKRFFPQSLNIKKFNGISFNKGCYIGQESISRHEYIGKNKFMLYLLKGQSKRLPNIGEKLKVQINGEWIQTGTVLFSSRLYNNEVWIQVVLKKIDYSGMIFRIHKDETSVFFI